MPTPIIDPATFSALQEAAGADFVNELVSTFFEEAPGLLTELRAAWGAKSAERFRRAAHSIKVGAGTFGFAEVGVLAHDMETLLDQIRAQGKVVTVCEDVPEHYAYWQAEVNPNPRDCCNLGAP